MRQQPRQCTTTGSRFRSGFFNSGVAFALISLALLAALGFLLIRMRSPRRAATTGTKMTFYCAAGIKPAIAPIVDEYGSRYGVDVEIQYGGSGTLLSALEVRRAGDLYLAGDASYIELAREKGLVRESIPLADMRPVVAVRKGNPKGITTIADLLRDDVAVALGNPEAAAIGRLARKALRQTGRWEALAAHCKVFKPTVNEIANDVKIGSVDAGIIWDATAGQYDELDAVRLPELDGQFRQITIGVLSSCEQPTAALHLARYIGARDRGLKHFERHGYEPVEGDVWAEHPKLLLYAGSMFNQPIEQTIREFERREGVEITRVYNGCGILVSQMRAGGRPDAYFSCDVSFMNNVTDLFENPLDVSENAMVIITAKGNPRGIKTLADLAGDGLKIGLAHPEKSALGHLTQRLLRHENVLDAINASGNWKVDAPQGDFLVNQLRVGALDAATVYRSNAALVADKVEIIPIASELANARQPYAVARHTDHKHTMERLRAALISAQSKSRFTELGFKWILEEQP